MHDLTQHVGLNWFYEAKWGVMFHFLAGCRQAKVSNLQDWDRIIDHFNVGCACIGCRGDPPRFYSANQNNRPNAVCTIVVPLKK